MPTVLQLADLLGVPCPSHSERELHSVNSLDNASEVDLSILAADKYVSQYKTTKAGGVLAAKKIRFAKRPDIATFLVDDPDLALVKVLELVAPPIPQPAPGVDATSIVSPTATIGENAQIGPHVSVGHRTQIGRNARIHPGVVISDDVTIGDDCIIYPNVVIRERITIGSRVIINAGTVIGTDGFGYRWDGTQHAKIPQIGTVVIEDDVEIGSCVCIDRAKFNVTRVGRGTKIDNQVQIAHNVQIGKFAIICGQVGIAGTARIGNGVVLGGAALVRDHVTIADRVTVGGNSAVMEDIPPNMTISGTPALAHRQALREQAATRRIPEVIVEMRKLQDEVALLKKQLSEMKP